MTMPVDEEALAVAAGLKAYGVPEYDLPPPPPGAGAGGAGLGPVRPMDEDYLAARVAPEPMSGSAAAPEGAGGAGTGPVRPMGPEDLEMAAAMPEGPPPAPPGVVSLPPTTVTPGPSGPARPQAPPVPDELQPGYGGRYYPVEGDYLSELETARLQGLITDDQARELAQGYESLPGLRTQAAKVGLEQAGTQDTLESRYQQAEARATEQLAGLAAERAAFERAEAETQRARQEAFQRGVAKMRDQMTAADERVRDYRVKDRRDAPTRIIHGISAALGALGAGLAKMPNYAMQSIEAQIDRDMRSQEQELQALREQGKTARSDLGAYYQEFGNVEQAKDALRSRYYREHAAKAAEISALSQNNRTKAALDYIAEQGGLRADQADVQLKQAGALEEQLYLMMLRQQQAQQQQQQSVGPFEWFDVGGDMVKLYVPEAGGFASSGAEKKEIAEKLRGVSNVDQIAGQMESIIQQAHSKAIPLSKAQGQLKTLQGQLHREVAVASQQGAIAEGEREGYEEQIPSGTALLQPDDTTLSQLRTLRGMAASDRRNTIQAYGVQPGVVRPTRSAKGKLQWQAGLVQPSEDIQQERLQRAAGLAGRDE